MEAACPCERQGEVADEEVLANTAFRIAEKKYKLMRKDHRATRRSKPEPETDLSDVVDPRNIDKNSPQNRALLVPLHKENESPCYLFQGVPGLVLFPSVLSEEQQMFWTKQALGNFATSSMFPNNLVNLDPLKATTGYTTGMRWATLGFKYNWTTKTYDESKRAHFPKELFNLAQSVASRASPSSSPFLAQTSIVNFYPVGSMMMAHQDISEDVLDKPLLSFSFGCSCVFLMGTESRNDPPFAFLLRSGDAAVFSGPSRKAFHSVPRIFEDTPPWFTADDTLRHATGLRVNINIRQVYSHDCPYLYCGEDGSKKE